jgi:signal transduction histidine kinase
MQRRVQELERSHAIERERARIAQDIHDDIGASLTRISMLSQCVNDASAPPQSAEVLERIYGTAREMTRALDEIVWAVDPRHDSLDSLVNYMGKFAQDFLSTTSIRCRLDLPVDVPPWPLTAETRHHLFLAFKEALNNALKHAAATEVRVSLALRPDAFVLTVKDDGKGIEGFDTESFATSRVGSGHGLENLRNRLARIGGRCEVATRPGEGTTISFVVAASESTSISGLAVDGSRSSAHPGGTPVD